VIHLVTYDLHKQGRNYQPVIDLLEKEESVHPMGSVWLLDTDESAEVWRDRLRALVDSNDEVLVVRLRHSWASLRVDADTVAWLKNPKRTW
jgi:CRISPR/Cas system-associated endoribonuclease Cas2